MKTQLTFKEKWYLFWGLGYLVNYHTGEIHQLSSKHKNCRLQVIASHNTKYVTHRKALKLINSGEFNGCRWCWKENDKG